MQKYVKVRYNGEVVQKYVKVGYTGVVVQKYIKVRCAGEVVQKYVKVRYAGGVVQKYVKVRCTGEVVQKYVKIRYTGEVVQSCVTHFWISIFYHIIHNYSIIRPTYLVPVSYPHSIDGVKLSIPWTKISDSMCWYNLWHWSHDDSRSVCVSCAYSGKSLLGTNIKWAVIFKINSLETESFHDSNSMWLCVKQYMIYIVRHFW